MQRRQQAVNAAAGIRRAEITAPGHTVIIPAYNAELFLERAVTSALEQTVASLEVIIVDDGSQDGTPALARALAAQDGRVRVLAMERNGGPGAARNLGLDHARGEWIAVLDADDAMAPTRLAQLTALAATARADVVADNLLIQPDSATGGPLVPMFQIEHNTPILISLETFVRRNEPLGADRGLGYLKPMVHRQMLQRTKARYRPELRIGEDYHFCLDLLAAGAVYAVTSEALYLYTARAGSISYRLSRRDTLALIEAHQAFVQSYAERMTPGLRQSLSTRAAALKTADRFQRLVESLRSGALAPAGSLMTRHPELLPVLARSAVEGFTRRIRSVMGGRS